MIFFKNLGLIAIVIAISFFSFNSLLRQGYLPMHDDMQPIRLLELDKCIKDGQIPCRWTPDLGYGYGYPMFIFYSPLAYYFMEIFHLVGFSILTSIKIGFIFSFIFSGLSMFLLGKLLWGELGGLVSSAFYVYAPYRASDVFSRGAVGEFWALIFLPLILWSLLKFFKQPYCKRNFVFVALSLTGLFLTHNLTTIAFTPFIFIWIGLLLFYYKKWYLLPRLFLSMLSGVLISAFYTIPLVFEKPFVHIESMTSGYFNYLAHFVSLGQMFWRGHWGFGSSELGPYDDLSFSIGVIHWLILLLSLLLFIKYRGYLKKSFVQIILGFCLLLFVSSVFISHSRSTFIWQLLPFMKYFQFPWRFLILAVLSTSIIAGYPVSLLKSNKKNSLILTSALILIVIFYNGRLFRPQYSIPINDSQKLSGESWQKQQTASIFDYLPIFALAPPSSIAPTTPTVIAGQTEIVSFSTGTDWQKGVLNSFSTSTIRLPLFYYPGFRVLVDGIPTTLNHQNDLGLIDFTVEPGYHSFHVKLTRTPDRIIGDILSIIGIIVLILYV